MSSHLLFSGDRTETVAKTKPHESAQSKCAATNHMFATDGAMYSLPLTRFSEEDFIYVKISQI